MLFLDIFLLLRNWNWKFQYWWHHHLLTDMREETCYTRYYRGQCLEPLMGLHLQSTCCCSIGAAWGDQCKQCPSKGSDQFANLCESFEEGKLYLVFAGIDFRKQKNNQVCHAETMKVHYFLWAIFLCLYVFLTKLQYLAISKVQNTQFYNFLQQVGTCETLMSAWNIQISVRTDVAGLCLLLGIDLSSYSDN